MRRKEAAERFPDDADLMYDYADATALSEVHMNRHCRLSQMQKKMKYFEDAKAKILFPGIGDMRGTWKYGSGNRK